MSRILMVLCVVAAFVISAADAYAWGGGGGARNVRESQASSATASVPEPSTLYALGSGLALLGGATWYIRRRK
jgi:hypothetical protein